MVLGIIQAEKLCNRLTWEAAELCVEDSHWSAICCCWKQRRFCLEHPHLQLPQTSLDWSCALWGQFPSILPKCCSYRYHCSHPYWTQYLAGGVWDGLYVHLESRLWIWQTCSGELVVNSAFKGKLHSWYLDQILIQIHETNISWSILGLPSRLGIILYLQHIRDWVTVQIRWQHFVLNWYSSRKTFSHLKQLCRLGELELGRGGGYGLSLSALAWTPCSQGAGSGLRK